MYEGDSGKAARRGALQSPLAKVPGTQGITENPNAPYTSTSYAEGASALEVGLEKAHRVGDVYGKAFGSSEEEVPVVAEGRIELHLDALARASQLLLELPSLVLLEHHVVLRPQDEGCPDSLRAVLPDPLHE